MTTQVLSGFEEQLSGAWTTLTGTASFSTSTVRSGAAALRANPASGASGYGTENWNSATYLHFGFRIATMPSVARMVAGSSGANNLNLLLNTDGTLSIRVDTTVNGTSTKALATGVWYWLGIQNQTASSDTLLQIDGQVEITGSQSVITSIGRLGCSGTEASAIDVFYDDVIGDSAGFLPPSKVVQLLPVSDNSRTNWTAGAGGTTNLWDAIDNVPPAGVASASETNTTNIESSSNTGTANYVANMATYASAGINATDAILGVVLIISDGEDIATGTKTGTYELTANPVIASSAITFGGDLGAHGAEISNWTKRRGTVSDHPSVTVSTNPTMKVVKTDTTTRTACIDFMAIRVAYTPTTSLLFKASRRVLVQTR